MGFQKGNNEDKVAFSSHHVEPVGRRYDLSLWMVTLTPWPSQASQGFARVSPLHIYLVPSILHSWERSRRVQLMQKEWGWQSARSVKAGDITQYTKSLYAVTYQCVPGVYSAVYISINVDQLYIKKWLPSSLFYKYIIYKSTFRKHAAQICQVFSISLSWHLSLSSVSAIHVYVVNSVIAQCIHDEGCCNI